MNKHERFLKSECKRKARAVHYPGWEKNYKLRNTGKPCSCAICSPGKVLKNGDKKRAFKELQFELAA